MTATLSLRLLCLCCALAVQDGKPRRPPRPEPPPPPKGTRIACTPTTVSVDGRVENAKNPIAIALERALPGARIQLAAGDYPDFGVGFKRRAAWNAQTSGGTSAAPIVVEGIGTVRILGKSDAISFSQEIHNGFITFKHLVIVPGYRAGILFAQGQGPEWVHEGFKFYDCDIIGAWDHLTDTGVSSKWGVWGQAMKDFEFKGIGRRALVQDLRREHGFYLQNPRGDILIEHVEAKRLGRTFCQFTARANSGPPGIGTITVRDCVVTDCCIAAGDGYKGGSAFTVAGRLTGTLIFENNSYRAGFDPVLSKLTQKGEPYGTGAFVAWDGDQDLPNGRLVLRDNLFELAPGCGDRPLVAISGCREVEIIGKNRFLAGVNPAALDIEPVTEGRPEPKAVGALTISEETEIRGPLRLRGKEIRRSELADEFARRKQ